MRQLNRLIATLLLTALHLSLFSQVLPTAPLKDDLKRWVHFMASDDMMGRANGSPEMHIVALYIEDFFVQAGLKPGFGSEFIREYTIERRGDAITERNVAAIIPGTDPLLRDEYIVLTAHFDHIGVGRPVDGDSIYNGANDNATGTAAIMGVARNFVAGGLAPGRTIVFVAVSGEEIGMRGSRDFVANSPVNLKRAYLNLNIEMVGHAELIGPERFYMTGESMTNIGSLINYFNESKNSSWTMDNSFASAERLWRSSDNISFATIETRGDDRAGVPSTTLCLHTGEDHLHRPWDKPEFVDYENMTGFVKYLTDLVYWLSHSREEVVWRAPGFVRYIP